ncbi:glutaminase [Roseovarius pacificus]|uniref:glutaminase n=1 Tax=Roseovarius pacificus TaxID=337701 RepID=UPI002A188A7C|nr:glutaminase [Roseovarius pacificus]
MVELDEILASIHDRIVDEADWGIPAQYIPELAAIPADQFAISVCLADGSTHSAGSANTPFSIQSISKVFALIATLGRIGEQLWTRVGREPTGTAFDSIGILESDAGRPRNPFINAGAIVTTDALLSGREPREALAETLGLIRAMAETDDIYINDRVARSEERTGARNKALAHYLSSHGNLEHEPAKLLGTYFHQCAIEMTTEQLAKAGRALARLPDAPRTISQEHAKRVNALMMSCGHYDASGEFAYRVGLPGKSGVGGGILIVAPHKASIGIWSPGLDGYGNSKAGTRAAVMLSRATEWSVF